MWYIHFFQSSPESILTVYLIHEGVHMATWHFQDRRYFHDLAKAILQTDRQINPEDYSEDSWKPGLMKAVIDALQSPLV